MRGVAKDTVATRACQPPGQPSRRKIRSPGAETLKTPPLLGILSNADPSGLPRPPWSRTPPARMQVPPPFEHVPAALAVLEAQARVRSRRRARRPKVLAARAPAPSSKSKPEKVGSRKSPSRKTMPPEVPLEPGVVLGQESSGQLGSRLRDSITAPPAPRVAGPAQPAAIDGRRGGRPALFLSLEQGPQRKNLLVVPGPHRPPGPGLFFGGGPWAPTRRHVRELVGAASRLASSGNNPTGRGVSAQPGCRCSCWGLLDALGVCAPRPPGVASDVCRGRVGVLPTCTTFAPGRGTGPRLTPWSRPASSRLLVGEGRLR